MKLLCAALIALIGYLPTHCGDVNAATRNSGKKNRAPVVKIACQAQASPPPVALVCDGSASFDPDGSIKRYRWTFSDGRVVQGKSAVRLFARSQRIRVTLEITDSKKEKKKKSVTVQVEALPRISPIPSPTTGPEPTIGIPPTPPPPIKSPTPLPTRTSTPTPTPTQPVTGTPNTPSGLDVTDLGNQIETLLNWSDNSPNETGFVLERQSRTLDGSWGDTLVTQIAMNSIFMTDTPGFGQHRYRISARNANGLSPFTAWVNVTVQTSPAGWTTFTPAGSTQTVYVSSSTGNDLNDGSSTSLPVRTLARAADLLSSRSGQPDWVLLKRGDTWDESFPVGGWPRSGGPTQNSRHLIGNYGNSGDPRPRIRSGAASGFRLAGSNKSHIALVGLHFEGTNAANIPAISITSGGSDILFEDVKIEGYQTGISMNGEGTSGLRQIRVRRSFIDASNGLVGSDATNISVEESMFISGGIALEDTVGAAFILGNTVLQSSVGIIAAGGGVLRDNLVGYADTGMVTASQSGLRLERNVVTHSSDGIEVADSPVTIVEQNVVAHTQAGEPSHHGIKIDGDNGDLMSIRRSVIADRDGIGIYLAGYDETRLSCTDTDIQMAGSIANIVGVDTSFPEGERIMVSGNRYFWSALQSRWFLREAASIEMSLDNWRSLTGDTSAAQSVGYPDASRSLSSYQASLGRTATVAAFIAELRNQSKNSWQDAYMASAVTAYIRAGFGL